MDINVVVTISSLLATLLVIINIYIAVIRKPQETQAQNYREVERTMNEFIATYSGEYAGLKLGMDALSKDVGELKKELKDQSAAIDELARELMKHELTTEKEVKAK